MKRWIAVAMAVLLALCAGAGVAGEPVERVLQEGRYIVGEDIEPGNYTLTCLETAGGDMKAAYGALGDALNALDSSQGYGEMLGTFGGMFAAYIDMTVEILGDFGDVLKRWEMKAGDSMSVALEVGTALRITDGRCAIAPQG